MAKPRKKKNKKKTERGIARPRKELHKLSPFSSGTFQLLLTRVEKKEQIQQKKKLTCGLVEFSITSHTFSVQPITQGFHVVRNQSSMDCVGVVFGVKDRRIGKLILGRKGAIPCDEPYLVHSLPVKPLSCQPHGYTNRMFR